MARDTNPRYEESERSYRSRYYPTGIGDEDRDAPYERDSEPARSEYMADGRSSARSNESPRRRSEYRDGGGSRYGRDDRSDYPRDDGRYEAESERYYDDGNHRNRRHEGFAGRPMSPRSRSNYGDTGGDGYGPGALRGYGGRQTGRSSGRAWRPEDANTGFDDGMNSFGAAFEDGFGSIPHQRRSGTSDFAVGQADGAAGPDYSGRGPKGWKRSDDRIQEAVSERLERHPAIDASEIEVRVHDGEVTLSGTVADRRMKRLAEDVAEDVSGVAEVQNGIRIKREGQSASSDRKGMTDAADGKAGKRNA